MRAAVLVGWVVLAGCSRKADPMEHARALYRNGDYEDAIRAFKTCLQERPEHLDPHREYQNALRKIGRDREALEHYGAILIRHPGAAWAHYLRARLESGEKLREGMKRALELDAAFAPALAALARMEFDDRRFEESAKGYERLFTLRSPADDELEKFARASFQSGRLEGLDRVLVLRSERATAGEQVLGIPLGPAGSRLAVLLAGTAAVPFEVAIQYVMKNRSYRMISAKSDGACWSIRWTRDWNVLKPDKLPEPGDEIGRQAGRPTFRVLHETATGLLGKVEGD